MGRWILLPLLLAGGLAVGQTASTETSARNRPWTILRFSDDNDFFKLGRNTDQFYTQGLKVEWMRERRGAPIFLDRWAAGGESTGKRSSAWGLNWGTSIYTPQDIEQIPIDTLDRPYAGWMWLAGRYVATNSAQKRRLLAEVSLGVIGPSALQAQFQTEWHVIIDSPEPLGWDTQIEDDIAINVQGKWEEGVITLRGLHVSTLAEVGVGSVANFIGIGAPIRLGWVGDLYAHAGGLGPPDRPGTDLLFGLETTNDEKDLRETEAWAKITDALRAKTRPCPSQGYFFVHPGLRFMAQNSLLQGGWFNGGRSEHTLSADEIEHFYAQLEVGVGLQTHWFGITFSQFFRTREFKNGDPSHWGAFSLTFLINGRCCDYPKQ